MDSNKIDSITNRLKYERDCEQFQNEQLTQEFKQAALEKKQTYNHEAQILLGNFTRSMVEQGAPNAKLIPVEYRIQTPTYKRLYQAINNSTVNETKLQREEIPGWHLCSGHYQIMPTKGEDRIGSASYALLVTGDVIEEIDFDMINRQATRYIHDYHGALASIGGLATIGELKHRLNEIQPNSVK